MLKLTIVAKNFRELHDTMWAIGANVAEMEARGLYDEGADEWIERGANWELDYQEDEIKLPAARLLKNKGGKK